MLSPIALPTRRPRRWLRALAVAGVVAATAFATVAPASAASMTARLQINVYSSTYGCTNLRAVIPLNQYDTWGYLNNGAHARVQLWGDDPVWDDLIDTTGWAYLNAGVDGVAITGTYEGIVVSWIKCYYNVDLYEDPFETGYELYAKVLVIDGDGSTLASAKSNVVNYYYVY